jgi:hypothetical protein
MDSQIHLPLRYRGARSVLQGWRLVWKFNASRGPCLGQQGQLWFLDGIDGSWGSRGYRSQYPKQSNSTSFQDLTCLGKSSLIPMQQSSCDIFTPADKACAVRMIRSPTCNENVRLNTSGRVLRPFNGVEFCVDLMGINQFCYYEVGSSMIHPEHQKMQDICKQTRLYLGMPARDESHSTINGDVLPVDIR